VGMCSRLFSIIFSLAIAVSVITVPSVRLFAADEPAKNKQADTNGAIPSGGAQGGETAETVNSADADTKSPEQHIASVRFPAMKGVRGLAESADMKKWLKGMISAEVPVMFQTMMMVENGAATGFMGSMQTISGVMDNQIQAAQLELRMREALDPSGRKVLEYVKAVPRGMKETEKELAWPVGLMVASGDRFDTDPIKPQAKVEVTAAADPKPANLTDAFRNNQDPTAPLPGAAGGLAGGVGSGPISLVDLLFPDAAGASPEERQRDQQIKDNIKKYIGDLTYKKTDETTERVYEQEKHNFVPAVATPDPGDTIIFHYDAAKRAFEIRRSFHLRVWENQTKVWDAWYKILGQYCKFKASNENINKPIFQKVGPFSNLSPEDRDAASSRDLKLTNNIVDRLFKLHLQTTNYEESTKITCDFEGKQYKETMPGDSKPASETFDNCKDHPRQCNRNKVILALVEKVAVSRTIEEFKQWYSAMMMKAAGQAGSFMMLKSERLVCYSLGGQTAGEYGGCDPLDYLERLGYDNQEAWLEEVEKLGKLAQGIGGSNSLRGSGSALTDTGGMIGRD
jgi:hypothetical protein